jgi:ribose 1,5-bisphosphate isomerase
MDLKKVCGDIRSLKIQGAENVSSAALEALADVVRKTKKDSKIHILLNLEHAKTLLTETRPTEPEMRNYIGHIINFTKNLPNKKIKSKIIKKIEQALKEKKENEERIIGFSEKLIKNNDIIFTHCHSSTVISILKKAHGHKKIKVNNTETRPLYQGRITAKELCNANIKVKHFVDAAVIEAMKDANLVLIGADAVTFNGVYNKIGSEMISFIADKLNKPLYICSSLWKFDSHLEKIEERNHNEVWKNHPKNLDIHNPAFEKIPLSLIKGIICEEGLLKPKEFIKKARKITQ